LCLFSRHFDVSDRSDTLDRLLEPSGSPMRLRRGLPRSGTSVTRTRGCASSYWDTR
jgi:hypothetical protein